MDRIVIHLGAFYRARTALAFISKRFGDARVQYIFIESEVVASGSMIDVINGHHYNGGIHCHKLKRSHL